MAAGEADRPAPPSLGPSSGRLILGYAVLAAALTAVVALVLIVGGDSPRAGEAPEEEGLSPEALFGRLMLAIAAVLLVARAVGAVLRRLGQPQVMGEVLGGIALGPSLLGAIAPDAQHLLFPEQVVPLLGGAADIGLAFYMFLVGLELDLGALRGRLRQAVFISNASVMAPMAIGMALALALYPTYGQSGFLAFALFMGVAMSVTAFPVLARILLERRMLRRPVGAISMASAAVDDVTAWSLLALAAAVAVSASALDAVAVIGLGAALSAIILLPGRRFLARVAVAYDEAGSISPGWMSIIFLAVLFAAFAAAQIGVAAIFGAFLVGLAMPRRSDLGHTLTERIEPFVVTVLLPLFFVVTGLKTNIGLINGEVALVTLLLLAAAIAGKFGGGMVAARYVGFGTRESAAIGALLNTRGLTELIVLNIGVGLGVLTSELFTALVVVALATTLMTGPALRLIDRRGELGAAPDEGLETVPAPLPVVLVAVQEIRNLDALVAMAAPFASGGRSELVIVHAREPLRVAAGIERDTDALRDADAKLAEAQERLTRRGVPSRVTAFASGAPGRDLAELAERQRAGLVVVDGQRSLLRTGVTGGAVGELLDGSTADVAVLARSARDVAPDRDHPVVVPFGGAEHEWAATEIASSIAAGHNAPLRLIGVSGDASTGSAGADRLLAEAALLAQRFGGVRTETRLVPPTPAAILDAAADAGLLVVGLSARWRNQGLGAARIGLVRRAPASILFVRAAEGRGRDGETVAPWSQITGGTAIWAALPRDSGQATDDEEAMGDPVDRPSSHR